MNVYYNDGSSQIFEGAIDELTNILRTEGERPDFKGAQVYTENRATRRKKGQRNNVTTRLRLK